MKKKIIKAETNSEKLMTWVTPKLKKLVIELGAKQKKSQGAVVKDALKLYFETVQN